MNYSEINFQCINYWKGVNPNFSDLSVTNGVLSYNGQELDISKFDIRKLGDISQLNNDIGNLSAEDLFNIIKANSMMDETTKKDEKEEVEAVKELNPEIKNIDLVERTDENGFKKTYVHYVDELGNDQILYRYAPTNVLEVYKNLVTKNNGKVTEKELFEELERKLARVDLSAESNLDDEFQKKLNDVNEEGKDNSYVVGNAEHDMIVADNKVYTYERDSSGNLLRQEHTIDSMSDDDKSSDFSGEQSVENEEKDDSLETEQSEVDKIVNLISKEEFYKLINSNTPLNQEQKDEVELFNTYLGLCIKYKEYLTDEVKALVNEFIELMERLSLKEEELSNGLQDEIKEYQNMVDMAKEHEREINHEEKAKLILSKKPPVDGYINIFAIICSVIMVGIISAVAILIKIK